VATGLEQAADKLAKRLALKGREFIRAVKLPTISPALAAAGWFLNNCPAE
jgi:hypothetical protein